ATGSGKSVLLRSLVTALAPTDDVIVAWDLKWGLEASVFGARLSAICETAPQVQASVNTIIGIAQQRVALFKQAGVTNIGEFEARTGVHLRRIRVIVDEVAELAIGAPDDVVDLTATDVDLAAQAKKFNEQLKIASTLNDFLLGQVLRIVQLVRFAGINVVLCGQRFGSDLGAKITAIRAQLPGRLCCGLNDRQTAEMTLPGMDAEVHARALSFHREGLYIAKGKGQAWHISRPPFTTVEQARHTCQVHAGNSIPLHQVPADDLDRTQQLIQQGENR
ncbi:MAG: hypothetical protein J2P17_34865, partial [Mycobacterium sp.]|nr:hypothetical protein [Mycobacterium sp.]